MAATSFPFPVPGVAEEIGGFFLVHHEWVCKGKPVVCERDHRSGAQNESGALGRCRAGRSQNWTGTDLRLRKYDRRTSACS